MKRLRTSNLFHRILAASSFAIGLAASVAPLGSADAATVTLSGGASGSCTYSAASVDANGNTTYTCSGGGGGGAVPGTLSFTTPSAITPSGVGTTVSVNRTSGTSGAVAGNLTVSGAANCSLSAASITFADGSATPVPSSVTVTPSGAGGTTCDVALTAAGGAIAGPPSTFTVAVGNPNAPVTFAFSVLASSTTFGGAMMPITVTRSGGTAGNWNVPVLIAGTLTTEPTTGNGGLLAGGGTLSPVNPPTSRMLNFPAGSQSAVINYTPPAAPPAGVTDPATLIVGLGMPTISGTLPPGQTASTPYVNHIVTVSAAAPSTPAPPGCTTTADHILAYPNHNFYVDGTKRNESTAVSMAIGPSTLSPGNGLGKFTVVESSSTGYNTDIQYTVSSCPGDFNVAAGSSCGITTIASGGYLTFAVGDLPPGVAWWAPVCLLPAGTSTVYFNFRQVAKGPGTSPAVPLTPSCTIGTTCPVWVQFN